jgi:hypothetical protein
MQVGSLLWNPHDKEILTGLGYSKNQLALWRWPSCQKIAEFLGHEQRVLHMALSPDGCTVCRSDQRYFALLKFGQQPPAVFAHVLVHVLVLSTKLLVIAQPVGSLCHRCDCSFTKGRNVCTSTTEITEFTLPEP